MKNIIQKLAIGAMVVGTLGVSSVAFAQDNTEFKDKMQDLKNGIHQIKDQMHDLKDAHKDEKHNENEAEKKLVFRKNVTVTAISGNTITANDKAGVSYQIDATNAKIIRKFGAKSSLAEMLVNDELKIVGKRQAEGSNNIAAKTIRNMSIHIFHGNVSGEVKTIGTNSFTVLTPKNETYTINVTTETKFKGIENHEINALTDLKVGDKVMVHGLKNTTSKTDAAIRVKLLGPETTPTATSS